MLAPLLASLAVVLVACDSADDDPADGAVMTEGAAVTDDADATEDVEASEDPRTAAPSGTMFVIMDPIGNVPIFLSVTRRVPVEVCNRAALIAVVAASLVIVATIVFVTGAEDAADHAMIATGIVGMLLLVYLGLRFSGLLIRVLRRSGILLLSRIAGLLLAAIAVQMLADPVIEFARMV